MTSVAYDGEPAPPLDDIHVQVKTVYIDISMFKMVPNLNTIVQSSIQNFPTMQVAPQNCHCCVSWILEGALGTKYAIQAKFELLCFGGIAIATRLLNGSPKGLDSAAWEEGAGY